MLFTLLLLVTAAQPAAPARPALARARAEKRPAMIAFQAAWCVPCRELEKQTLRHPAIIALLKDHVVVRVDAEQGEGPELAQAFDVFGYPTLVFLGADGREVGRLVGFATAEELIALTSGFGRKRP